MNNKLEHYLDIINIGLYFKYPNTKLRYDIKNIKELYRDIETFKIDIYDNSTSEDNLVKPLASLYGEREINDNHEHIVFTLVTDYMSTKRIFDISIYYSLRDKIMITRSLSNIISIKCIFQNYNYEETIVDFDKKDSTFLNSKDVEIIWDIRKKIIQNEITPIEALKYTRSLYRSYYGELSNKSELTKQEKLELKKYNRI